MSNSGFAIFRAGNLLENVCLRSGKIVVMSNMAKSK